ncbi:MAG: nuclear transport factor 2 family protein, partial [Nocardiopsaceae bacterium]|nr:nuclear transport factor 2 family protein [Nocardiopsaceae bacterium]
MPVQSESRAVAIARAHVEAWNNHDWDAAEKALASDVHVIVLNTQGFPPPVDTTGTEDYMTGLRQFASAVKPGSARIIASTGDDRNALITLTVEADFGGNPMALPG